MIVSSFLKWFPSVGLLLDCVGAFLLFRHGDANRKFGLSVVSMGLLDEEPEKSPRRMAEKNNLRWEKIGFGLILLGSALQLASSVVGNLQ